MNPDCYETQHQKPHNKLKKAQIPLRENKLSLELKLGGGSTNPRSKGTPQPPLRRKSIRGAFSYLFSRAPLVFAGCPRVLSSRIFSLSSAYIYPPGVHCGRPRLRSRVSLSVCLFVIYGSSVDFRTSVYSASAPHIHVLRRGYRGRVQVAECRSPPCSGEDDRSYHPMHAVTALSFSLSPSLFFFFYLSSFR